MKKNYLMMSLFALGLATTAPVGLTSCSSDDPITVEKENPFDYGDDVASADDNRSAGEAFKCVEQILDGCIDIANEVGESKIGEPLNLFNSGQQEKALYAVESWYSYHHVRTTATISTLSVMPTMARSTEALPIIHFLL